MYKTLTDTTTMVQSGNGSNVNEVVFYISQISRNEASPSDVASESYPGPLFLWWWGWVFYSSAGNTVSVFKPYGLGGANIDITFKNKIGDL